VDLNHSNLCLSLLPKSESELYTLIEKSNEADILELRLDFFRRIDFKKIRKSTGKKLLLTLRLPEEGGFWQGTLRERNKLFKDALEAGIDHIDLEWKSADSNMQLLEKDLSEQLVLSHHTDENNYENLRHILSEMIKVKGAIYKLIFTAYSLNDVLTAWKLIEYLKNKHCKFVIHAMGEAGEISRIIGGILGNEWTYVSLDDDKTTATGQFSLKVARSVYHLHNQSPDLRLIGLLGYPIAQSVGWKLHNRLVATKKSDLNGKTTDFREYLYVNFPVEDFTGFWNGWQDRLTGLSVTIPYKETIVNYLDNPSSTVLESGVCNTIVKINNKWYGYNTDLMALVELLKPHQEVLKKGVFIIGAGATARSAIVALKQLGISKIYITDKNSRRGELVQKLLQVQFINLDSLKNIHIKGVIQATPVGMYPDIESIPPGSSLLRKGQVVLDVVYNPYLTKFLQRAKEIGCTIIPGEKMFVLQAIKQFKIFSGATIQANKLKKIWQECFSV
jgi:3-dehydroquinate dehydratase/shikimate dehydrogenase